MGFDEFVFSVSFFFLVFQQLEIDYVIGESHKQLLPNSSGPAAIIRIFGVTKEGKPFFSMCIAILYVFDWCLFAH